MTDDYTIVCPEMIYVGDYDSHRCGRPIDRHGLCKRHATAAERRAVKHAEKMRDQEARKKERYRLPDAELERLRAYLARLIAERDGLGKPLSDDLAATGAGGISAKAPAARRYWQRMDRELQRHTELQRRITPLETKINRAEWAAS